MSQVKTNILITGGTSALAMNLINYASESFCFTTAGRTGCDTYLDLEKNTDSFKIPEQTDVLLYTAAAFGGKTMSEKIKTENINVISAARLFEKAVHSGVKHFIYISSIYAHLRPGAFQYSVYSASKKHSEELLGLLAIGSFTAFTILRLAPMYGDTDRFRIHQPMIYQMADVASSGGDIVISGQHDALRNFIHVDDVCDQIVAVIKKRFSGAFDCAFPSNFSFSSIANAAIQAFGSTGSVKFAPEKADIPDNIFPAANELYLHSGIEPRIDIYEGMRRIARQRTKVS